MNTAIISNTSDSAMSRDAVLELWAESIIDNARFENQTDRVLARYEDVDALFPSADELQEKGADIVAVAKALEAGLDPIAFGKAVENGLNLETFSAALNADGIQVEHFAATVESLDIETLNGSLEHVVEACEEVTRYPSETDRILARLGE
jgi:hypothetical protein